MEYIDDVVDNVLIHYGKKGMKWGVIASPAVRGAVGKQAKRLKTVATSPTVQKATTSKTRVTTKSRESHSEDAKRAAELRAKINKEGTQSLSNKELQDLVTRMNLASNYAQSAQKHKSSGRKFAENMVSTIGKDLSKEASKAVVKGVSGGIAKRGSIMADKMKEELYGQPMSIMWGE